MTDTDELDLPDDLLERLDELQRREDERGLTNAEQEQLEQDVETFIETAKPAVKTMVKILGDAMSELVEGLQPELEELIELVEKNDNAAEAIQPELEELTELVEENDDTGPEQPVREDDNES